MWTADRQRQPAVRGMERHGHGRRRRPEDRPVVGRQRQAEPRALGEALSQIIEAEGHRLGLARHHRIVTLEAMAARQIEHPVGDQGRGAVGRHLAEPRDDDAHGLVDGEPKRHLRRAEELQRRVERCGIEDEGAAVIGALIDGQLAGIAIGAPFAGGDAGELGRAMGEDRGRRLARHRSAGRRRNA